MIAAYIRISRDVQDTSRQRDALKVFSPDRWYVDDQGKNPRDLPDQRPEFQRMLADVRSGLITKIIVDRQDRFGTRDAHQFGRYLDELRQHNCELHTADGKLLTGDDELSVLTGTLGAITSRREQK